MLCELVAAQKQGKTIQVIGVGWPGPSEKEFHFPRHLNEALDDWEDVRYTQRLREPAAVLSDKQHGTAGKLELMEVADDSILGKVKNSSFFKKCWPPEERPTNPSSWVEERWNGVSEAVSGSAQLASTLVASINPAVRSTTEPMPAGSSATSGGARLAMPTRTAA